MSKRKHQQVIVKIDRVDFPNRGEGHILVRPDFDAVDKLLELDTAYRGWTSGRKIICKGGIEGQIYRAVTKRSRGEAKEVTLLELLERSPLERGAACPQADICGGCSYQTLSYETELMIKGKQMTRLFREAGIDEVSVSISRSPLVRGYRNKMEYTFGDAQVGGDLMLGLHRPGHFYEIVPTPACNIVPQDFNHLRAAIQSFCRERGLSYFHRARHTGYLRHCVIRGALTTGQLMVNLVTTSEPGMTASDWTEFVAMLRGLRLDFELTSVYHTINDAPADAVIPQKLELLFGEPHLTERLFNLTFHVGPFSFFQPNVPGAERLYDKAVNLAGDLSGRTVYDLYSGTGTITQIMAKRAQRVIGVELVEEAAEKAKESALRNGIVNVRFIAGDVLAELDRLAETGDQPGAIVIDPPREGIHPQALQKMLLAAPSSIVYISCNPRTMVRDLNLFKAGGYAVEEAHAFDQFPRTRHVETVVSLSRK